MPASCEAELYISVLRLTLKLSKNFCLEALPATKVENCDAIE